MYAADRVPALVRQIQASAGLPAAGDAERAAIAVLQLLVPQLPEVAATASLNALLEALVAARRERGGTPEAAVMREFDVPAERAAAIVRAIVVVVLETLGDQAPVLYAALPEALRPSRAGDANAAATRMTHLGTTLAEGRPGSRRPVAQARPERAHSESLVSSADPYAASRLSSTEGLSPERRGRTLADARQPSERALAGPTKDDRRARAHRTTPQRRPERP
jgi:hypothetical protein